MMLLLLLAIAVMFLQLTPRRGGIVVVHRKTAREEAMHDQIQAAMNWRPEHFKLCADGKYRNAYGQEGVSMTLKELLARHDGEVDNGK